MAKTKLRLCAACGRDTTRNYARVTVVRDGISFHAVLLCERCFDDSSLASVEARTTWSSAWLTIG